VSADRQVTGEAIYTDDEPNLPGTLYAAPVLSKVAHARITSISAEAALEMPGVVAFYGASGTIYFVFVGKGGGFLVRFCTS
jgi:xanthine dehydrogenase molybdopterin-binding subunit B